MRNLLISLTVILVLAYSVLTSWIALFLLPILAIATICHEVLHYLALKPWDEDLYLEVWPLIDFRDHESTLSLAHVGGQFSNSAPLPVVGFATIAPTIVFGILPLGWVLLSFGTPAISFETVIELANSPSEVCILAFFGGAAFPSSEDLQSFRDARRIRDQGSLERDDWDVE